MKTPLKTGVFWIPLMIVFISAFSVFGQGAEEFPRRWFWQESVLSLDDAGRLEYVLKAEQDYSEVKLDYYSGSGLSASGRWRIEPAALSGRTVTVKGFEQDEVHGQNEVFSFPEDIEDGILRFEAEESWGSWHLKDKNPPAITWALVFGDGSTNYIGQSTPSLFNHRWSESALSQGRKISLSGMPMPDVAQHREGESDYEPESTYVDALSLDVRHDVTDIHVPVGSDHFALEVRRSLAQESWTTNSGAGSVL